MTAEPNWNPEVVDCVYTIVCDPDAKKGAICNADDAKQWDVNGCPNSDINLMQGCEMKKGDSLDISNLMHRESNLFLSDNNLWQFRCILYVNTNYIYPMSYSFYS